MSSNATWLGKGELIKKFREHPDLDLSQEEAASKAGVKFDTWKRAERGKVPIRATNMDQIAKWLEKMRLRFLKKGVEIHPRAITIEEIATLVTEEDRKQARKDRKHAQLVEWIDPTDPEVWEGFVGDYQAYNPPFARETMSPNWQQLIQVFVRRFLDSEFQLARYLFYLGTVGKGSVKGRLTYCKKWLKEIFDSLKAQEKEMVAKKIRIAFRPGEIPQEEYFIGTQWGQDVVIEYPKSVNSGSKEKTDRATQTYLNRASNHIRMLLEQFNREWDCAYELGEQSVRKVLDQSIDNLLEEVRRKMPLRSPMRMMGYSPTLKIREEIANLNPNIGGKAKRARGDDVIDLAYSRPPLPIHQDLVKALQKNAHQIRPLPAAGLRRNEVDDLRKKVLTYYDEHYGVPSEQYESVIGPGSKLLLCAVQTCIGGDLLLPLPAWGTYAAQARMLGDCVIPLCPMHILTGEYLLEQLENARRHGENPTKLILNYPSNPTGQTLEKTEVMEAIADVCKDNNILIISDETYGRLTFGTAHTSISKFAPENTVVISKQVVKSFLTRDLLTNSLVI